MVAPILFGLDKFFNVMVEWPRYLAPWLDRLVPGNAQEFMYVVGAIEIVAGLVVLFAPEFGGYLVAAWLGGIIVNLLTADPMRFYDVALRDFGCCSRLSRSRGSLRAFVSGRRSGHSRITSARWAADVMRPVSRS